MSGILKQSFLFVFLSGLALSVPMGGDSSAGETAVAPQPALPSIVAPGRPHGQRDPHSKLSAETQIQIALRHKNEGRPHEAINTLTNALMRYRDNAQLYAVRGSLYLEQNRITDALRDLEASLSLNPDDSAVLTNRAQAYRRFGRLDEALADLDRAVALDPDLIAARFNRGAMLYEKGELERALKDFNQCIALDPHAPGPYFNRAAVYDAMNKRPEAVADINRFMELTDNENWKNSARDILKAWENKDKTAEVAQDS